MENIILNNLYTRCFILVIIISIGACTHLEKEEQMHEYFVGFDYSTGGMWYFITAPSKEAIEEKYPNMPIYGRDVPDTMFTYGEKGQKRHVNDLSEKEKQSREKSIQKMREMGSYHINKIPEIVHDELLGKDFHDFFITFESKGTIHTYILVAFNKEEVLWRYPNVLVSKNTPDFLQKDSKQLTNIKKNHRYHIQNIPDDIHEQLLAAD